VTTDTIISLVTGALAVAIKVALPMLLAALIVGLAISIFQAVTQIQEMTLSFVPKILVMAAVTVIAGPWMLDQLLSWTQELYLSIPSVAGPDGIGP
jgi:flagellar biosynthesis protein FliQ